MNLAPTVVELLALSPEMIPNRFKPGQSIRFSVTASLLGVLTAAPDLSLTVKGPDGTTINASVVADSPTGTYHADVALPMTAVEGVWVRRWQAISPHAGLTEARFQVDALDY